MQCSMSDNNPDPNSIVTLAHDIVAMQNKLAEPIIAKNIENNGGAEFANNAGRKSERRKLKAELRKKGQALPPLNPATVATNRSSQGQRLSLKLRKKMLARKLAG